LERARRHVFVAPDLNGPETGGTLYNARLIAALRARAVACRQIEIGAALAPDAIGNDECVWVDSLYFAELPALQACAPQRGLRLVLHYLPSQVAHARMVEWHELSDVERRALERAAGFLVTSPFMAQQLACFELAARSVSCVEPGVELPVERASRAGHGIRALMLCNVVEGKGVLPFLGALADQVQAGDRFELVIAGGLDAQAQYARSSAELIRAHPDLRARVQLRGALPHHEALRLLQSSDVLLSASRMEAYGMALAEARTAGIPIIARAGGHAGALVRPQSGGVLVTDECAVATELLAHARDPSRLFGLQRTAYATRLTRTWQDAASDFCAQLNA
jgi:glycosyltransferase involved in cell wall biosynthesis